MADRTSTEEEPVPAGAGPAAPPLRVLIIDDEKNIRATLGLCLEGLGLQVAQAASAEAAREALRRGRFDLAFLDLRLGADSGLDLLPQLLAEAPELQVVVITAYATFDTAVEAVRRGARDYLPKPFTPAQIRHVVEQVQSRRALTRRDSGLEQHVRQALPHVRLRSRAPTIGPARQIIDRAAPSDATVLLAGENGTCNGGLPPNLHLSNPHPAAPFVVVNCPTLSEELLASELFGHVRGAFTGAVRDQPGRVEAAQGGTLFLDEIGEISPALQSKLLRFLQDHEFERVGETRTRRADVRVVAATNRDLEADVRGGKFREDLLYRLNVVEVRVPALRERPEDILPLAEQFLAFFARLHRVHSAGTRTSTTLRR